MVSWIMRKGKRNDDALRKRFEKLQEIKGEKK